MLVQVSYRYRTDPTTFSAWDARNSKQLLKPWTVACLQPFHPHPVPPPPPPLLHPHPCRQMSVGCLEKSWISRKISTVQPNLVRKDFFSLLSYQTAQTNRENWLKYKNPLLSISVKVAGKGWQGCGDGLRFSQIQINKTKTNVRIRICMDPELLPGSWSGIIVPDPDPAKSERADE